NIQFSISGYYSGHDKGGSNFVPAPTPIRVCDTRPGNPSGLTGQAAECNGGTLSAGQTLSLRLADFFGIPDSATAVVLNVTAIKPSKATHLTVYPTQPRPKPSDLPVGSGQTRSDLVLGTIYNGSVIIYNQSGNTNITVDLLGWYDGAFPQEIDGTITVTGQPLTGFTGTVKFVAVVDPSEGCDFADTCTYELQ